MGPAYAELRRRTQLRISAGEIFWGGSRFAEIRQHRWADVIMPDVKHVGGFGPLLDVMRASSGAIEVSPHNPAGPISTAASLHAAAIYPDVWYGRSSIHSTGSKRGAELVSESKPACCC